MNREEELNIDDALAQALTSAIASRAAGDEAHVNYLLANIVLYSLTIHGIDTVEFLSALRQVEEHTDFSQINSSSMKVDDEELPEQNAPSTDAIN